MYESNEQSKQNEIRDAELLIASKEKEMEDVRESLLIEIAKKEGEILIANARTGIRTRVNCLEGNYPNHQTNDEVLAVLLIFQVLNPPPSIPTCYVYNLSFHQRLKTVYLIDNLMINVCANNNKV